MTKKLFVLLAIIHFSGIFFLNAQPTCNPDSTYINSPSGIYPDSIPTAYTYQTAYEASLTAVICADTTFDWGGQDTTIIIDSIGIITVQNLPTSFNWTSNSSNNYWHGGSLGCLVLYGNPSLNSAGKYPLSIRVRGYFHGLPGYFQYDTTYILNIVDTAGVTICDPDTNFKTPGIYPDNITTAYTSETSYEQLLTFVTFEDTVYAYIPVHVDSMSIISITGLPPNFSYITNSATDTWIGGVSGCLVISGNPSLDTAGLYPLTFNIKAYLHIFDTVPIDTNYAFYKDLYILDTSSGIASNKPYIFKAMQNIPNPFRNVTDIYFTSSAADNYSFMVYNMIGEIVYSRNLSAVRGKNKIVFDATGLNSGIYLYKLSNSNFTQTKRMIISR